MEIDTHSVYVKTNQNGYITEVNSSAFISDQLTGYIDVANYSGFSTGLSGWVKIDEGVGDKYHHAQGNYFPKPIATGGGAYRYKLVDGKPVECTAEEIAEQEETLNPEQTPTLESRVHDLETDSTEMREALEMILSGVTE